MALTQDQLAKASKLNHLKGLAARTKLVTDNLQSQINALGNDAIKSVKVNGVALTSTNNAVDILATMEKLATAESGYASSYQLKVNGVAVGDKVNIAKDWLLKAANLLTSTAENYETVGTSAAGKKYIDFVFNVKADGDGGTETDAHIYLPVEDLVDVYTAGNGLQVVNNEFSIKIDATNANGLSVSANGLAMGLATDSAAGAMSAADHTQMTNDHAKLSGVSTGANKTEVTTEKAGTIEIDGTSKTIVEFATDAEVTEMLDTELPAPAAGE